MGINLDGASSRMKTKILPLDYQFWCRISLDCQYCLLPRLVGRQIYF